MKTSAMLVLASLAWAGVADTAEPQALPRVRPANALASQLLEAARSKSPSVAAMLQVLERSDVIVLVLVCPPESSGWTFHASVRFLSVAGGQRYVAVWVQQGWGAPFDRLTLLGHELAHAVEIARAPEVVDEKSLFLFYMRIGRRTGPLNFETEAATEVESRVAREVLGRHAHIPPD